MGLGVGKGLGPGVGKKEIEFGFVEKSKSLGLDLEFFLGERGASILALGLVSKRGGERGGEQCSKNQINQSINPNRWQPV